jgi:hypothetical protein
MSTNDRLPVPLDDLDWVVSSAFPTFFRWEYEDSRPSLAQLYGKGKRLQWNSEERIDWSQDLDPENPMQFLHGEEGALICTAKIVQQAPTMDANLYAATQVVDEARHVSFGRLALRDYYTKLTDEERDEREEFAVERDARPLRGPRGVPHARPARRGMRRLARPLRADAALPREPGQVHRALDRADRCLGRAHPLRIREHWRAQLRGRRSPTARGGRRPRRHAGRWRSRHRAGRGELNRTAR